MAKRKTTLSSSIKQIGEIQVNDWDFMGLLNKDISELEISGSLKRLGGFRVMEWDFNSPFPAVNKLANRQVDLIDIFKRTARYKIMEWDFKNHPPADHGTARLTAAKHRANHSSPEEIQAVIERLRNFLQYVTVNLIDEPSHAQIMAREIAPGVLRFKLVLTKRDLAMLIGRQGHTAAAIRNLVKSTAGADGVHVLLQIHSHEEEAALVHAGNGDW